jgi:F0F1-type ATP synthase epsilon subunit
MRIIIQSPTGVNNEIQDVESLRVILTNGYPISILSNHAPLMAQVSAGSLEYKRLKDAHTIPISDSIMIVKNNLIKILTINNMLPNNL